MSLKILFSVIKRLISIGVVISLYACAPIVTAPSEVWNLPEEVNANLSVGETLVEAQSLLGAPFIESRGLGIDVYKITGTDTSLDLFFPFIPTGSQEVNLFVLVAYDENEIIQDLAQAFYVRDSGRLYISANGYSFMSDYEYYSPRVPRYTFLGQSIHTNNIQTRMANENVCALVFLSDEYPLYKVKLDKSKIVNIIHKTSFYQEYKESEDNYGVYIRKEITPGRHKLRLKSMHTKFETEFECKQGEVMFVELKVHNIIKDIWWGSQIEGEISISESPPAYIDELTYLRPILWHDDVSYSPLINMPVEDQDEF